MTLRIRRRTYVIAAVLAAGIGALLYPVKGSQASEKETGLVYLHEQETRDLNSLSNRLAELKYNEVMDAIEAGKLDAFSLFQDYVFLGDSRVTGFDGYGFLDDSRVLGSIGTNIYNIDDWLETIESMQPSTIYISYGINDVDNYLGKTEAGLAYDEIVSSQIQKISAAAPGAAIVVNSIIDVSEAARKSEPAFKNIDAYNQQIKSACQQNGWVYVDNDCLTEDDAGNIYERDGIHFVPGFYEDWAMNIISAVHKPAGQDQEEL